MFTYKQMDHFYKLSVSLVLLLGAWLVMVSAAGHGQGYGLHLGSSNSQGGDRDEVCDTQCEINGMKFDGNSDFSLRNGCIEYSKCRCFCDGNWRCYDGIDLCNPANNAPDPNACRECEVNGIYYPSNSAFDYRRGCEELTGCYCRCNGSWTCQTARNTCPNRQTGSRGTNYRTGSRTEYSSSSSSGGNTGQLSNRDVDSSVSDTNSGTFSSSSSGRNTGSSSSSSSGRNTGSSSSSSSSYSYTSSSSRQRTSSSSSSSGSGVGVSLGSQGGNCNTNCLVNGQEIPPNSYFKYTNSCIEYQSCYCSCTGFWQCSAETGINTCSDSDSRADLGQGVFTGRRDQRGCLSCDVHGTFHSPDTSFTYRNGCVEWQDCRCECDGGWQCQPNRAKWICENVCRQCEVEGQMYDGNTEFVYRKQQECIEYDPCICNCDGSWNCPAENGRWICTDRCLQCDVEGRTYEGGTNFKLREDCWEWDPCICSCNGSYRCPKENAKWVCTDRCLTCDAKGSIYQGNTQFKMHQGCYQYNCDCKCDGSWTCPANRTIDTCNQNATTGCFYCNVHGEQYQGNSFFSHTDGCIRYNDCTCRCDGSWDCPGENAVDTCRQNATSGCYSCDVYGTRVEGYSRFQLEEDCWRYECECDCAGGWQCSRSQITYLCGSQQQVSTGCRDCLVSGNRYASRSVFNLQWGCINYSCRCSCDGRWDCPAESATVSCAGDYFEQFQIQSVSNIPSSWCKECIINGHTYPGNSQFDYRERCINHHVRCYCNGGYRTSTSVDTECTSSSRDSTDITRTQDRCRRCIMNGETFPSRAQFSIDVGCITYRCRCRCSGLPECTPGGNLACGTAVIASGSIGNRPGTTVVRAGGSSTSSGSSSSSSSTRITGVEGTIVDTSRTVNRGGSVRVTSGSTANTGGRVVTTGSTSNGGGSVRVTSGGTANTGGRRVVTTGSTSNRGGSVRVTSGGTANTGGRRVVTTGSTSNRGGSVRVTSGSTTNRGGTFRVTTGTTGGQGSVATSETTTGGGNTYGVFVTPGRNTNRGTVSSSSRTITTSTVVRGGTSGSGVVTENTDQCRVCLVNNVQYATNAQFEYTRGCIRYQCTCSCSGEATCKPAGFTDCQNQNKGVGCRRCAVEGRRYQALSQFTFRKECNTLSCLCECSGRAVCIQTPIPGCDPESKGTTDNRCRECRVDGQIYPPNSIFNTQRDCLRYTCQCGCNGIHRCTAPINTCGTSIGQPTQVCRECRVGGRTYTTNEPLVLERGCWRQQCICSCNGQPDCNSQTAEYTCTDDDIDDNDCVPCNVNGIDYPPNSKFVNREGCIAYKCHCFCNGNHYCVGTGTNVCSGGTDTIVNVGQESVVGSTTVHVGTRPSGTIRNRGGSSSTRTVITTLGTSSNRDRRPTRIETSRTTTVQREEIMRREEIARQEEAARQLEREALRRAQEEAERRNREEIDRRERENAARRVNEENARRQREEDARREREESEERERVRAQEETERRREQEEAKRRRVQEEAERRRVQEEAEQRRVQEEAEQRRVQEEAERQNRDEVERREREEAARREREEAVRRARVEKIRREREEAIRRAREEAGRQQVVDRARERERDIERERERQRERDRIIAETDETNCQICTVDGNSYNANDIFYVDRRCKRYKCTCYCNGRYACRTGSPINICDNDGNVIETLKTSSTMDTTRTNSGTRRTGRTENTSSRTITTDNSTGRRSGTGSSTTRRRDKNQGTQTVTRVETTYYETFETRQGSSVTRRNGEDVRAGRCGPCVINGQSYPGRREFQLDDGCKRFQCNCKCDGSWLCPRQKPARLCGSSTSTSTGSSKTVSRTTFYEYEVRQGRSEVMMSSDEIDAGVCGICVVDNQPYKGGREFTYIDSCKSFRCLCSCDGSWNCPRQIPTWGCQEANSENYRSGNTRTASTDTSSSETVETRTTGSRTVSTQTSGSRKGDSSSTSSSSSGSFERTVSRSGYSSGGDRSSGSGSTSASSDSVASSSSSTSSSTSSDFQLFYYEYEERQGVSEIQQSTEGDACGVCEVAGNRYNGGSTFRYDDQCKGFNCSCNCDGSWLCPSQRPRILCPDQCKSCTVRDEVHAFNSRFLVKYDDCRKYMCTCHCNGRFTCLHDDVINACEEGGDTPDQGEEEELAEACSTCIVNDEERQPNTRFQYRIGCKRFVCTCDCTGHHECSEENVCSDERLREDGCRECVINGTRFPPNSQFQYIKDCYRLNCDCACDGSYDCPSRNTEYVCDGGCQQCLVNNQAYRGNTQFQYEDDCYRYSCNCSCDGSFNCPSDRTVNICNEPVNCRKCHVNDESYDPDTFFQYDEGCHRFSCDCFCNGSYNCPASRTENMCGAAVGSGPCTQCVVNGTIQQPNTDFYYTNDCVRYRCHCGCNGAWDCQFESAIPNCQKTVKTSDIDDRQPVRRRCRACVVDGRRYRPNSRFQYTKGCDRFECNCGCDGSFNCPANLTRNVCGGDRKCKDCRVRGTKYSGNSVFVLRERCLQYRCFCSCNGEWDCPADRAVDTCTGQS
ncbi:uncharacterized protein LOC132560496 [Ylistrum balloti]|uniref:uncharacterized protein LOC132560496 n=1 Tax=Ylistrum balloti TaxID=509963 RepID=UPI0029057ED0|nr:uncharacterized protein LOC132560496 [Ylistrum balloti]